MEINMQAYKIHMYIRTEYTLMLVRVQVDLLKSDAYACMAVCV